MNNFNTPNFRSLIDKLDDLSTVNTVNESFLIEDQALMEGFIDNLTKIAGNAVKQPFTTVSNSSQGAAVIVKAMTNPTYLDTLTFLMKKYIKNSMKEIKSPQVLSVINRIFPAGRTAKDFVKALFLLPIVNLIKVSLHASGEQITDTIKDYLTKITSLDQLVNTFLSQGFSTITSILSTLKLTNVMFFDILNMLNKKINSSQVTQPVAESYSYQFKMSNYKPIV